MNVEKYLKQFHSSVKEEQEILWMEARLLEAKGPWLFRRWEKYIKDMTESYCRERLEQTNNIQLKTKYSWDLWWLTGENNAIGTGD
jgi:hypothetical protein